MNSHRAGGAAVLAGLIVCCGCQSPKSAAGDSGAAGTGAWRETFAVNKVDLGPTGKGEYFVLQPGTVRAYREGETRLTIRVLDETRVVDGVTTRVVEEREEEGGALKEVSRNYFAIDRTTGDVYYFGEDVDIYAGGKVTSHGGAWLSGVNGARFGLAMPGKPSGGQRYYQEVAPGVAMDRGEIVSVDETVKTPAGTFRHCIHVRETTPIEKDVGHKWYAPGIGLIKDDELALTSATP